MNNTLNLALQKAARNLSVDSKLVESVYKSYWYFIKTHVSSLPLREMDQEEFDSTATNFNIPFIGKLYTNYKRIEGYRKQLKFYEDVKTKENKANRLSDTGD
jgi:hypothetical protein